MNAFMELALVFLRHSSIYYPPHSWTYSSLYLLCSRRNFLVVAGCRYFRGQIEPRAAQGNSRCPWRNTERTRESLPHRIRPHLSPLRPGGSGHADVHGCPRRRCNAQAPLAMRDTRWRHTGGENDPITSPFHGDVDARPSLLFRLLAMALHTWLIVGSAGYDSTRAES